MGETLYLIGVVLSGYAGYSGLQWYFIFISSLIMTLGYFIIRAPTIRGIYAADGIVAIPKLLFIQIIMYSIVTAPVYFIASFLN